MDVLRDWQDAPALVLSCPGPARRHGAALLRLSEAVPPQVFLGGESQLLAFAAAVPGLADRLFFAPLPEMFAHPASLAVAWGAAGRTAPARDDVAHLRFGSVRDARILKGACNAAVIAEAGCAPPVSASHHPFASGQVLPAAIRRLFVYGAHTARPQAIGGEGLPETGLSSGFLTADLDEVAGKPARRSASGGLDLVSLAAYSATDWAAGHVGPASADGVFARSAVLVPWNMAHFGSIVPELLTRLARLRRAEGPVPALVIMPFNYLGLTGMIRGLIADLRKAAEQPDSLLAGMFLARVTALPGLARLKSVSRVVWIDGNDPEAWWTQGRFTASGFDPILIDPAALPGSGAHHFAADDPVRIERDTRFGTLGFDVRLPSLRALPALLALTGNRPRRRGARKAS